MIQVWAVKSVLQSHKSLLLWSPTCF